MDSVDNLIPRGLAYNIGMHSNMHPYKVTPPEYLHTSWHIGPAKTMEQKVNEYLRHVFFTTRPVEYKPTPILMDEEGTRLFDKMLREEAAKLLVNAESAYIFW